MQSASVSALAPQPFVSAGKSVYFEESVFQSHNDLTIEYTGSGGDLFLHMSTDVYQSSSVYTEQGSISSLSQVAPDSRELSGSALALSENESSATAAMASRFYDIALKEYHDLIRQQVAYLLGQISGQQESVDTTSAENLSNSTQESSPAVTTVLYSESVSVSQSVTVSGSLTDPAYFSAENTAERIVSFALSFYDGGDREAYAQMVRDAVMKGFNEAMTAFGGFLPQESYDTISLVNEAINDFAQADSINLSA